MGRVNVYKYLNNKEKKGFTLIELLVTLLILSIVVSFGAFIVVHLMDNVREKGYKITINNVLSSGDEYLLENSDKLFFVPIDNDVNKNEYQCVTIQELIDKGYFKNDILNEEIGKDKKIDGHDYVYLEREPNSKTLVKSMYIDLGEDTNGVTLCRNSIKANGSVSFSSSPTGWSQYKDISIYYKLKNIVNDDNIYKYKYVLDSEKYENIEYQVSEDDNKKIRVTENGTIYAYIDGITSEVSLNINNVDSVKPVINMGNYTGNNEVFRKVTIPLVIEDNLSGLNKNTFIRDDIEVFIGDLKYEGSVILKYLNESNGKYNYELRISDIPVDIIGDIKINVLDKSFEDNAKNLNDGMVINTGITVDNKFEISYDSNGGTGSMEKTTCTYGKDCILRTNSFNRTGYSFKEWSIVSNSDEITYGNEAKFKYVYEKDITLYAVWEVNEYTYNIVYKSSSGLSLGTTTVTYNYGTTNTINALTKTGYTTPSSQSVKWDSTTAKTITFTYEPIIYNVAVNLDGGNGVSNKTYTIETETFAIGTPSKIGHKFLGWTGSNGTTPQTSVSITKGSTGNKNYTANWEAYKLTIKYDTEGGTIDADAGGYKWTTDSNGLVYKNGSVYKTTGIYGGTIGGDGLSNYNNSGFIYITKSGYAVESGKEWKCLSGCSTSDKIFNQNTEYNVSDFCDISSSDCTVVVGVNWIYGPKPIYTYLRSDGTTANHKFFDQGNGNWKMEFYETGILTVYYWGAGVDHYDAFLVGGGGGGGGAGLFSDSYAGGGGGGGYVTTKKNIPVSYDKYDVTIGFAGTGGAGGGRGNSGKTGGNGGSSSMIGTNISISVSGGSGGYGGGSAVNSVSGGAGGAGGGGGGQGYALWSKYNKRWENMDEYGGTGGSCGASGGTSSRSKFTGGAGSGNKNCYEFGATSGDKAYGAGGAGGFGQGAWYPMYGGYGSSSGGSYGGGKSDSSATWYGAGGGGGGFQGSGNGGGTTYPGGNGYQGIVMIRNKR